MLAGRVRADNNVTIRLNGAQIAYSSLFQSLVDYGTTNVGSFNPGLNTVTYDVVDTGGPAGFRAAVLVGAEEAPAVPLPASAALIVAGLAAFGAVKRRSRR